MLFGGGAEQFFPNSRSFQGKDYYAEFRNAGYNVVLNKTSLDTASNSSKTLGIFSVSNMAKWLDRHVYPQNLNISKTEPSGGNGSATDQPGLKDMTLKAIQILHNRHPDDGFFLPGKCGGLA